VFGLLLLIGLAVTVAATVMPFDVAGSGDLSHEAIRAVIVALGLGALGVCGACALLIGGLWVRLARWLGGWVDAADLRHAQALVGLVAASVLAFVPLIALGGEAPALRVAEIDPDFFEGGRSTGGQVLDLIYELAWTIPLALLLVGVPIQRSLPQAVVRLGIRPIGLRGLGIGIGGAAVLWVVGTALDQATYWLWGLTGWPRTDGELVDRLMGVALSPVGALVAATAAGLGEELMMRGVLQPRFGWLLPNLAFTAAHALQYNLDALSGVFVAGAILALIRSRWSTSEAIVAHGLYDLVLFLGGAFE
jgi:membrane protease YdiL (CAAX protease family)